MAFASRESRIAKTAPFGCSRAAAGARSEVGMSHGHAKKKEGSSARRLRIWRRMTGAWISIHVSSTSIPGMTGPDQMRNHSIHPMPLNMAGRNGLRFRIDAKAKRMIGNA